MTQNKKAPQYKTSVGAVGGPGGGSGGQGWVWGFVTLPFCGVAQRLKIKGKVLTLGVGEFTIVVVGFPWFLRGRMWELRLSFWFWKLF